MPAPMATALPAMAERLMKLPPAEARLQEARRALDQGSRDTHRCRTPTSRRADSSEPMTVNAR